MKETWMSTMMTAAILASGSAFAQSTAAPEMTPPAKDLAEDRNHDGVITRDEVKPGTTWRNASTSATPTTTAS